MNPAINIRVSDVIHRDDIKSVVSKYDTLALLLSSPTWPIRDDLTDAGKALYDALNAGEQQYILKQYCLNIVNHKFKEALDQAIEWMALVNPLMDDSNAIDTPARAQILTVLKYFVEALKIDFQSWS